MIAVVGAGPAGSTFAYFAAKSGFEVKVFDIMPLSRAWSKPCGDAVGKDTFRKVPLPEPEGDEIKARIRRAHIYSPDYEFRLEIDGPGYIIDRVKYGREILEKAMDFGAEFVQKPVFRPLIEGGRVMGIAHEGGKTGAELVVDASGFAGVIKSKLPESWAVSEPIRHAIIAFRGIVEVEEGGEEDAIKLFLDQKLAPKAYWWDFPEGDGIRNIGLGVLPGDKAKLMPNYRKILSRYKIRRVLEERGAFDPVQRPPLSLVGPGVLVLGDAAPTVDPLTGGGMGSSMEAAYLAARALEGAAEDGFSYQALWGLNAYLRAGGAVQARNDMLKFWLWRVGEEKIKEVLKMVEGKNLFSVLLNPEMGKIALTAKRVQDHYRKYPASPEGLEEWVKKLETLYNSF